MGHHFGCTGVFFTLLLSCFLSPSIFFSSQNVSSLISTSFLYDFFVCVFSFFLSSSSSSLTCPCMQQPDYRDQSDPDKKDDTYQSSQSISNDMQNRAAGQLEQEKETDRYTVRSIINNMTANNSCWRPNMSASAHLLAESQHHFINQTATEVTPKT